jgi:hypothetical protein
VNDLSSPEKYSGFDLVALLQESDDVVLFEIVVVVIRVGSKLHFLDRDVLLVLLRFVKFLVQLVKVLPVVHDPANRRLCSRRYLYQIQAPLFRDLQRLLRRHNAELFILVVDDSNLSRPDALVHPYVFIDGLTLLTPSAIDKR